MRSYNIRSKKWIFGETYTTSSHKPDKNKVMAITKMPAPTNKKQVQSFIGMINYFSKFSARLSEIAEPIREFAKDKVPFNWGPEHQSAIAQMKQEIVSAPILAYFKLKKQTVLQPQMQAKRFRPMSAAGRNTSSLCQQSFNRCTVGICSDRNRIACCCLGDGEVSSFPVSKPFHLRN